MTAAQPPTSAVSSPVAVLGPTASGKSDVAMAVATASRGPTPIEIVAVDAMQVYRHMDVGTAKPTKADQGSVPHHGIDLVDPDADYTVASFVADASASIDDIAVRGARALLVAGTGLYLRALTDPMEIPPTWPTIRAELDVRAEVEGVPALHAELLTLDPVAAARMEPTNARRVVRALEVCLGSGRPFSSFGPGLDTYAPTPVHMVGIQWDRPVLTRRIERRVQRMIDEGLVAEVEGIRSRFPEWSRTARQALGYREVLEHLDGGCSLDEAIATTILRTRQFAVRQERWFRRDRRIRWVHVHDDAVAEVAPILQQTVDES